MTQPDSTDVEDLPDEEVWVASGDVRIPLVKMGETHLRNALRYMQNQLAEAGTDELALDDIEEKLAKLEGEVARRLNEKPSDGPQSLPITETRRQADEAYRRLQR